MMGRKSEWLKHDKQESVIADIKEIGWGQIIESFVVHY